MVKFDHVSLTLSIVIIGPELVKIMTLLTSFSGNGMANKTNGGWSSKTVGSLLRIPCNQSQTE